ncbi:MAG: N-acetyltransferase [Pseudomonadota bacterium]
MPLKVKIRQSSEDELPAILDIYPLAFPEEDLRPLVEELLNTVKNRISLVALSARKIIGHAIFTDGYVEGHNQILSLLGPFAVVPNAQRQGVGSTLMLEGKALLNRRGCSKILLLGDPKYYVRHGFVQEEHISAPYEMPQSWRYAWQGFEFPGKQQSAGKLILPEPWMKPDYWMPMDET